MAFYGVALALAGYLVAVDTGRRTMLEVWIDILVFAVIPLLLVIELGLIIGLAVGALVWALFFLVRNQILESAPLYTALSIGEPAGPHG